jgi:hypothetical protein
MFRSRKRSSFGVTKALATKAEAVVAVVETDDAEPAPTPEKQQHPVAAFANTVYVDPVVKVSGWMHTDKVPHPPRRFSRPTIN